MSLMEQMQQIDRRVKAMLRTANIDELDREELHVLKQLKQHSNEARLDVREYEYAETRLEQEKAAVKARRNLAKLEKSILQLSSIFGPADTADLGAHIDTLKTHLA